MMSYKELAKLAKKVSKGKKVFDKLSDEDRAQLVEFIRNSKQSEKPLNTKAIKMAMNSGTYVGPADVVEKVREASCATAFMEHNATEPYIAERLRVGYKGKVVYMNDVPYIQAGRGKPYGTAVAVKTDTGVVIGVSFINPLDESTAVKAVGLKLAYDRALEGKKNGNVGYPTSIPVGDTVVTFDKNTREQLDHFELRALAYFHKDKYSHSAGSEPVEYKNFKWLSAFNKFLSKNEKFMK